MSNKFNDDAGKVKKFDIISNRKNKSKLFIFLLIILGIIVLVLALNIFHSQRNVNNPIECRGTEEISNIKSNIKTEVGIASKGATEVKVQDITNPTSFLEGISMPDDAIQYNDHYYMGFTNGVSWTKAEQECANMGGHLISINSQEEMDIALSIAKELGKDNIWIGGKRSRNSWEWSDGSEFIYQNCDKREVFDSENNETIVYEQPDDHDGIEDYIRFPSRYIEYPENYWWANEG